MKGLIGRGIRLRPFTATSAKQLVPVANTPILFYGFYGREALATSDISEIGIVVGDTPNDPGGRGGRIPFIPGNRSEVGLIR
jgi:dTDP-glucose pyrophosphorylase